MPHHRSPLSLENARVTQSNLCHLGLATARVAKRRNISSKFPETFHGNFVWGTLVFQVWNLPGIYGNFGEIYKTVSYTNININFFLIIGSHACKLIQILKQFWGGTLWCFFQDLLMNKNIWTLFIQNIFSNNISLCYYFLLINTSLLNKSINVFI